MPPADQLTKRQRDVYEFIRDKIQNRGYGPTVREIGEAFAISSPNGVMCHLKALEKKGLIIRAPNMSRAITLPELQARSARTPGEGTRLPKGSSEDNHPGGLASTTSSKTSGGSRAGKSSASGRTRRHASTGQAAFQDHRRSEGSPSEAGLGLSPNTGLPLAGCVAAGMLQEAVEQQEQIDFGTMFAKPGQFVLRVRGDSMIDAQIADGDYVVIKKQHVASAGQMVVAQTADGEATLKYWFPEGKRIRLQPANSDMKPIFVKDARVLGVVVGVVRRMG